jgi:hypothetical protein
MTVQMKDWGESCLPLTMIEPTAAAFYILLRNLVYLYVKENKNKKKNNNNNKTKTKTKKKTNKTKTNKK